MAITKANIISWINDKLSQNFSGTDIDDEIAAVLNDLTVESNFLRKSASCLTVVGQHNYGETAFAITNLKSIVDIKVDDEEPLIEIDWETYQERIANEGTNRGEPDEFYLDELNKMIYVYPAPNVATYTLYLQYYAIDNNVNDIQLPDEFRYLIYKGVGYEILEKLGKGQEKRAGELLVWYEAKKSNMAVSINQGRNSFVKYRDLG